MARRKIKEGHLGDMAYKAEMDHEVQMARSDLYKIAKYAVELHDMLKGVSEAEGIEGWQQSKITKAADYIGSVYHSMDYDTNVEMKESIQLDETFLSGLGKFVARGLNHIMSGGRLAAKGANKAIKTVEYRGAVKKAQDLALQVEREKANNIRTVKQLLNTDKIDIDNVERAIDNAISLGRNIDKISGYSTQALQDLTKLLRNDIRLLTKTQNAIGSYYALKTVIALLAIVGLAVAYSQQKSGQQVDEDDVEEGNAYAHAVRKAKMDGKKKGDVISGPDGKDITIREHDDAPDWIKMFMPGVARAMMGHPDFRTMSSAEMRLPGTKGNRPGKFYKPDELAMPDPELDNPLARMISKLYAAGEITHDEYEDSMEKIQSYTGNPEDFKWSGHYAMDEGKKKAKPDYLDFDGDGNKTEPMKKALKDKKRSVNESMLRRISNALNYRLGKIGTANVSPKAKSLAESMSIADLSKLKLDFKKKVIAEETAVDRGNAYFKLTGQDPQQSNLSDGQKLDLHKRAEALIKQYGLGGVPQPEIEKLQQSAGTVNEGQYGEITHTDEDATQSEVLVKGMGVYRMDQLEQRLKDRLNNVLQLIDRGEPDQAAKLLDPNSSTYKSLMVMMNAFAEAHDELAFGDHSMGAGINESATVCEDCGKPSWRTMSKEELDEAHGNDSKYDKCWKGCLKVPGKKRGEKGSCKCP